MPIQPMPSSHLTVGEKFDRYQQMNVFFALFFTVWSGWRLVNVDYQKHPTWYYLLDGLVFSFNLSVVLLHLFP